MEQMLVPIFFEKGYMISRYIPLLKIGTSICLYIFASIGKSLRVSKLFTLYQFITTMLILVNSGNRGQKTPCKYNVHENCIEYCYAQKKTITVINKNINEPTIHEIQIWPPSNVYPYKHLWPNIYITSDVTILEYWKYRFFYYSWFNMQVNTSI